MRHADATQFIAPVAQQPAGGMPPPQQSAEATQFLPPIPASDLDRTQYIAPFPPQDQGGAPAAYGQVPGEPGERQPPAEFDNLFRTDGAGGGTDSTRQLPVFDASQPPQQYGQQQAPAPYGQPSTPYGQQSAAPYGQQPGYEPQEPRGRRGRPSPLAIVGAVVVGCAVIGLGAGALLSGGGDKKDNAGATVASSTAPAASGSSSGSGGGADPAKAQAQQLDQLLADSNNSRESVIRAVADIKGCDNLDQATGDLHAAAQQRRGLVDRLQRVKIDQLPGHEALASSLTKAWRASADADDFYAQWADQAKSKKICRHGHARDTQATAQGNRASGEATAAKQQASPLWNGIASKYGLTNRAPSQL
jgi:hypothetical protein